MTPTSARLIAYWTDSSREKRLFFCQNEALQTAIYIAEVAKKYGDAWIENAIREANDASNPGLPRAQNAEVRARSITPPVFIVVCNNTNVSKLVFDFIGGWEKQIGEKIIAQAGQLPIFRNDDGNGAWLHRPNTILVDSQQLESGESMSADFKKIASREIDEFKTEYSARFPGRDSENLTDEDLLREVMNTVGKAGKLGEHVKCVVSVSMLTEGWDANTVTHVLGVRAFSTQLLCEQVVGRALRRMSYAANDQGHFEPEYAEVYGVPFSFIPCSGATTDPSLVHCPPACGRSKAASPAR